MASESSLNRSMDSAKRHYSSMFFLPSFNKALLAVALICIAGVSLSAFALFHSINSLLLGISFFAITFLIDLVISKIVLKSDPIFSMRRTLVLSLAGWLIWLFFNALGVGLSFAFSSLLWVKLCLLGFAGVVTLRSLVFYCNLNSIKVASSVIDFASACTLHNRISYLLGYLSR